MRHDVDADGHNNKPEMRLLGSRQMLRVVWDVRIDLVQRDGKERDEDRVEEAHGAPTETAITEELMI